MDYDVKIEAGEGIRSSHGVYNAEKLIKMYLLKVQELNYVDLLRQDQIEEKPYYGLGKTKKYDVLRLDNEGVFNATIKSLRLSSNTTERIS